MNCQGCGKENPEGAKFCQGCGASLEKPGGKYCPACGSENVAGAGYCANCGASLAPEPPAVPPPSVPVQHPKRVVYAGFWMRFLAYMIDSLIFSVVLTPLYFILIIPFAAASSSNEDAAIIGFISCACLFDFVVLVVYWLYFAIMESSRHQATLGKMALGIIVTDLDGNRIGFGQASGRFFGKILSGLILDIGFIMAGFTEKKQALHDMIAGCLVVMKRS